LSADPGSDLNELRQQLQAMKKQTLIIMDQSRKSSEKEKLALQQAQEALALKEAAVVEAAQAASQEDYMLQLMTDASLDMAGMLPQLKNSSMLFACLLSLIMILLLGRSLFRSNVLIKLALDHGSDFWATPDRTRQIVTFQDCARQVRQYLEFCTKTLAMV
jgi:hypothetical protein